jgi:hypothetical protein
MGSCTKGQYWFLFFLKVIRVQMDIQAGLGIKKTQRFVSLTSQFCLTSPPKFPLISSKPAYSIPIKHFCYHPIQSFDAIASLPYSFGVLKLKDSQLKAADTNQGIANF